MSLGTGLFFHFFGIPLKDVDSILFNAQKYFILDMIHLIKRIHIYII